MDHAQSPLSPDLGHSMLRDYMQAIKAGIVGGNLITFLCGFLLASRGQHVSVPPIRLQVVIKMVYAFY